MSQQGRHAPLSIRQRARLAADEAAGFFSNLKEHEMTTPDQQDQAPVIDVAARFQAEVAQAAQTVQSASPPPAPPQASYTPTGPQPVQTPALQTNGAGDRMRATTVGWLHRDLGTAGAAISHAWPIIKELAANPQIEMLVESALRAADAGVAVEVFQSAIDAFEGASARAAAAQAAQGAQAQTVTEAEAATGQ